MVPIYITLNAQLGYSFLYNIHQIYSNRKKREQKGKKEIFLLQRKKKSAQFGFDYASYLGMQSPGVWGNAVAKGFGGGLGLINAPKPLSLATGGVRP